MLSLNFCGKSVRENFCNFHTVVLSHNLEITKIYSLFFGKNFVKITFSLKKKLQNSWFDEKIWIFRFSTLWCHVHSAVSSNPFHEIFIKWERILVFSTTLFDLSCFLWLLFAFFPHFIKTFLCFRFLNINLYHSKRLEKCAIREWLTFGHFLAKYWKPKDVNVETNTISERDLFKHW